MISASSVTRSMFASKDNLGLSPRHIWDNGRAVARARWFLRSADELGSRVRLRGTPQVTNRGRLMIGERVQLVSTVATLELVTEHGAELVIGPRSLVNFGCSLVATQRLEIGSDCHIGPHTMMLDNSYHHVDPERRLERPPSQPIVIGDNVWVGARSILMPGVTVGRDSCIGAGSVVTNDVPERTLVAGVPARPIREI